MPRRRGPCHADEVPPRRETTLHLLLTHPDGERVGQRTLTVGTTTYYGANVLEAARAAGLPVRLLRRLAFNSGGEEGGVVRAETIWQVHADDPPPGLVWQCPDGWPERERAWAHAALTPHTPRRAPWFHPDWAAGTLAWLDEELRAQGLTRTGEPTVLKHWQISLLWRVPTSGGVVYLKAVPDFFGREVRVTPALAAVPGAAPPVLAAHQGRGLLLLAEAGTDVDAPDLPALLRHLARVQRASLRLLPDLGLEDRGPAQVRSRLDDLLSDGVLLVGEEGGLTPGEAGRLRALRPELGAALSRLEASPLPLTLGHGDLHGGNVVERAGGFTLLDWSDACVTHPFLDANAAYLAPHGTPVPADEVEAAHTAYLEEWADLAPLEDLRALHADALRVGELFRALGYVEGIQPHVEDPQEWRGAHLEHLRTLLAR